MPSVAHTEHTRSCEEGAEKDGCAIGEIHEELSEFLAECWPLNAFLKFISERAFPGSG